MPNLRVRADVKVNIKEIENLVLYAPDAVVSALKEVTAQALQIAKNESRVDTSAMQKGWRRSQVGFKGSLKAGNTSPGYRLYNNTLNQSGETYTQFHEFGTSHIEPQPMLQPAMDYIEANLDAAISNNLQDAKDGGFFAVLDIDVQDASTSPM
jgi:HK97 gp10 family phage protein